MNNFNVTAGDDFYNQYNSTINANYVTISADSFDNTHTLGDGNISADSFALSVEGDFDYTKKGTITTNTFNLNVGGDFSNNDSANDFTWGANDALTVSGSASIDAADFKNNGVFNVGDLNITAAGDFDNYATIDAENFNVTVVNNFNNRSYATSVRMTLMLQQQIIFTIQIAQRLVRTILLSQQILLLILIQEEMVILMQIH